MLRLWAGRAQTPPRGAGRQAARMRLGRMTGLPEDLARHAAAAADRSGGERSDSD